MCSKIVFLCLVFQLVRVSISKDFRSDEPEVYCYSNKTVLGPPHTHFTTKTTYALVQGKLEDPGISACEPVKIWLLTRHGTNYPLSSTVDLNALKSLKEAINVLDPPLCEFDKLLLQSWEGNDDINQYPDKLSNEGINQMRALAVDYKTVFENLFEPQAKVMFRHTTELRNNESFSQFANALFGENENDIAADFSYDDLLFKFYEKCDKWNEKNGKINEADTVLSKFEKSARFTETIEEISVRLGLEDNKWEQIKKVWDMCRIDKALTADSLSPWCAAFTQAHVDVLEYYEDIELYYKTGQGDTINSKLACKTVVDLMDHLENNDTESHKAIVSFVDATTVQLFLTALRTQEDSEQPSIDSIVENRKWKSSETSPFASNVAVVKYDCPSAEVKSNVKFFLNQKLLKPDWCTNGVCGFNEFLERYKLYKNADCTEYFCSSDTPSKSTSIVNGVGAVAVTISLILIHLH